MKKVSLSSIMPNLGTFIRCESLISPKGNAVPNQFNLIYTKGSIFQSYESIVGVRIGSTLGFTENHTYSTTTSKYCNIWSGYNRKEREKGIKNGEYLYIEKK